MDVSYTYKHTYTYIDNIILNYLLLYSEYIV